MKRCSKCGKRYDETTFRVIVKGHPFISMAKCAPCADREGIKVKYG